MSQAFYEMAKINGSSVMVNIDAIDSVSEYEQFVEITLRNGEKHSVIPQTFFVALNDRETPYFKIKRDEEAEPVREVAESNEPQNAVEGEVV